MQTYCARLLRDSLLGPSSSDQLFHNFLMSRCYQFCHGACNQCCLYRCSSVVLVCTSSLSLSHVTVTFTSKINTRIGQALRLKQKDIKFWKLPCCVLSGHHQSCRHPTFLSIRGADLESERPAQEAINECGSYFVTGKALNTSPGAQRLGMISPGCSSHPSLYLQGNHHIHTVTHTISIADGRYEGLITEILCGFGAFPWPELLDTSG